MAAFSRPRIVAGARCYGAACRNNTDALHSAKNLEGMRARRNAASYPCENREENNMRAAILSENLTQNYIKISKRISLKKERLIAQKTILL